MTTSRSLRRRLDKLTGPPVPTAQPETTAALLTLREATVSLCGDDREPWLYRCATGRATPADMAILDKLPAEPLKVAGVSGIEYACLMHQVLTAY